MNSIRKAAVAVTLLVAPALAQGQVSVRSAPGRWVGSPTDDYARLLQLTGVMPLSSMMLRPMNHPVNFTAPDTAAWRAPWSPSAIDSSAALVKVELIGPELWSTWNSNVPYGKNDGAMWGGRGTSGIVRAGLAVEAGPVRLQLAPEFSYSKNEFYPIAQQHFNAPTSSIWADRWLAASIDLPQRFGDKPLARTDLGQSSLMVEKYGVRVGVSTGNMWWGPGMDNSLLMTNHGPGFTHTVIGTSRPANVWIGKLELQHVLGWLPEHTDFWRDQPHDIPRKRWLNALSFVFEPRGAPGMYFGATRMFYAYESRNPISMKEIFWFLQSLEKAPLAAESEGRDDVRDQMMSLWMRWVFPSAGLEVYGELGRNDHAWNRRDLILEPDHTRAYLIGTRKAFPLREGILALRAEAVGLGKTRTMLYRGTPFWYGHSRVRQGYTNRGQVVGAGAGPGGDQQTVALDWFHRYGSVGLVVERQQVSADGLYRAYDTQDGGFFRHHDVFLGAGPRATWRRDGYSVSLSWLQQREYNRYNIVPNDVPNTHLELRASYTP